MPEQLVPRAVVLGGSLAGLLAANVLSEVYPEVLVVDRDELAGVEGPRRGVPHGRHAHGLVARGQQILEQQFPGLLADMEVAGIRPGDFSGNIRWYFNGMRLSPAQTGLLSVPCTRPVIERVVRSRVQKVGGIRFLEQHDIIGLETTPDAGRVTGVRVQPRNRNADVEVLHADLVIDTTGRGSRTPVWLEELGYSRPTEDKVAVNLAYTTRHFRVPRDPFGSDIAVIAAATPSHPRGAFYYRLPGDDGRVELSLTGVLGDHPPTDPEGFLDFVRSLPVPEIYESVREAEPIDDAVMFRFPASVRRRYERLTRFPRGLLVIGDAVCSFNPVYAQGMAVAAIESRILAEQLRKGPVPEPREFFREIARQIDSPWDFAATADLGYAGVKGDRTPKVRMINAYVARLQRAAVHDPSLTEALMRVAGLIDEPTALLRPDRILRTLRHSRARGSRASAPAPLHAARD
ncbi:2-polyprenyl-6-methoxyphenol hydroxylase-like FAD-dependent oxidoreductase [Micromonospora sp. M71_S20]|uniref:NAD(P)/FAD-dependent oxidoreductase n=1 Tax=Micromonospora sp. M71_S20 TaxID=592872 RepID=UPI000EAF9E45|nr:FAD-dependent monooxygenase [Micromonospora sp. M71_S20]RLK09661.1 2-polyprenyl-6-methoxyphenol hydroxylase-like FAD-dependent oxidoreductase [Micromonospora sp. M71_S20]